MGILDMLSGFRDLFEVTRKTDSDKKSNKPEERQYKFELDEPMPKNRREYNAAKKGRKTPRDEDENERGL